MKRTGHKNSLERNNIAFELMTGKACKWLCRSDKTFNENFIFLTNGGVLQEVKKFSDLVFYLFCRANAKE